MKNRTKKHLSFRAGDRLEVRPLDEILETLDERGMLGGVPFMPEMVQYCGKSFEVWRRAGKTCDEGRGGAIRGVTDTVHLKELRCDGSVHGGCDAGCLLFWKEHWLKRADAPDSKPLGKDFTHATPSTGCTIGHLVRATRREGRQADGDEILCCQATQVHAFSKPLAWWDVSQYVRDITTGNVSFREFFRGLYIGAFNKIQHLRKRSQFRSVAGTRTKTPQASLDLVPGDLVRIKSSQEIVATLDQRGKNAGLAFRPVMVPYCGKEYRVVKRVNRIISPDTGKMLKLGGNCVILDGVVCTGEMRRFCPRMVYTYWRDIWLTKVGRAGPRSTDESEAFIELTSRSRERVETAGEQSAQALHDS